MVSEGHGTILPAVAVAGELESGMLRAHTLEPAPYRKLNLVWPDQQSNPMATAAVVEVVMGIVRELVESGRWTATLV